MDEQRAAIEREAVRLGTSVEILMEAEAENAMNCSSSITLGTIGTLRISTNESPPGLVMYWGVNDRKTHKSHD
eukprot:5753410-Pyramimonas_sp.AAC.1